MGHPLEGRKVAIVATDGVERIELEGPRLRMDGDAVAFVKEFVESGKPVAAICHGPWTLAEADVVRGHRLTSWPSIRTDLRNAGADVVDEEVVVDGSLTTSRSPHDLPAFCAAIVEQFAHARAKTTVTAR